MRKVVAFLLLVAGCGPSAADLADDLEACLDRFVTPVRRQIADARTLSRYLEDLPPGELLSTSEILRLVDAFDLDIFVDGSSETVTSAANWDDALWQQVLPALTAEADAKYADCQASIYGDDN